MAKILSKKSLTAAEVKSDAAEIDRKFDKWKADKHEALRLQHEAEEMRRDRGRLEIKRGHCLKLGDKPLELFSNFLSEELGGVSVVVKYAVSTETGNEIAARLAADIESLARDIEQREQRIVELLAGTEKPV